MRAIYAVLASCMVLLSGCATSPEKTTQTDTACSKIQNLAIAEDDNGFVTPDEAIRVLSACELQRRDTPAIVRASVLKMRSVAYGQIKDYSKAIADAEEVRRLLPARTAWDVIFMAALYRDSGQPEKALGLLRNMLKDHLGMSGKGTPPGMPSYYHLGLTLVALEKWPEAAEAFTEGLTYQPDYIWAYMYRALSFDAMNDSERARADVREAQRLISMQKGKQQLIAQKSLGEAQFSVLLKKYRN
ncbi:MAG: tetratricopeptide repeat protein [Betaproteobacteria bacterium]|nr:MAG: tetratricopeptide repeat protein [Betaproteobacteria bacterium]